MLFYKKVCFLEIKENYHNTYGTFVHSFQIFFQSTVISLTMNRIVNYIWFLCFFLYFHNDVELALELGDGGGRPSSVMSLGVTSVGGHSHGHPESPIGVGSSWEDIDPRSPEPLVVRGGWLWLIWVVRCTT